MGWCGNAPTKTIARKEVRVKPYKKWRNRIVGQTCNSTIHEINKKGKLLNQKLLKEKKKINEEHYIDIMKDICNPYKENGEWITYFDLIKKYKVCVVQMHTQKLISMWLCKTLYILY